MAKKSVTLEEYLEHGVYYDENGQQIYLNDGEGSINMFLDVRGWGHIQHLFDDEHEAGDFQDSIGEFVADAINDRIRVIKLSKTEEQNKVNTNSPNYLPRKNTFRS